MKVTVKHLVIYCISKRLKCGKRQLLHFIFLHEAALQLRIRWISTDKDYFSAKRDLNRSLLHFLLTQVLEDGEVGGLGEGKY